MRTRTAMLAVLLLLPCAAWAQDSSPPTVPEEASRRLAHIIGEWDSRWEWLDPEGKPIGTESGTEVARYLIGQRVVELTTTIVGRPHPSKAWMFFGDNDRKFHLVSVSGTGDYWSLHGGLDSYVITSDPHLNPDGSSMIIRFTHYEDDHDHLRAEMESSSDGGSTWRPGFRQYLTRRSAAHSAPSASDAATPVPAGVE